MHGPNRQILLQTFAKYWSSIEAFGNKYLVLVKNKDSIYNMQSLKHVIAYTKRYKTQYSMNGLFFHACNQIYHQI